MKPRRPGYTLAELLVVIVLTSTVMGAMTVTLYSLTQADRTMRDDLDQQIQLQRLTEILRTDIHQSKDVVLGTPPERLVVSAGDGSAVSYTIHGDWIDRQVERDGVAVVGDQYQIPPCAARWQVDKERVAPLVVLSLDKTATPTGGPVAETIRIMAARLPAPARASTEP